MDVQPADNGYKGMPDLYYLSMFLMRREGLHELGLQNSPYHMLSVQVNTHRIMGAVLAPPL